MFRKIREYFLLADFRYTAVFATIGVAAVLLIALMFYYDHTPDQFSVTATAQARAERNNDEVVVGYVMTNALIEVTRAILYKRGGYLHNDVMPPSVWMDNVPSWELGALTQVRDLTRALHNDISRSQTQSAEDPDLLVADGKMHFDADSWMLPRTESEYADGIQALEGYLERLSDADEPDAQFYARADNLRDWLALVEKSLGSLSQRLAASVEAEKANVDLSGEAAARQSTPSPSRKRVKTPWIDIDNVFYEARGSCWALLHFLRAAEIDFESVLADKNASASLQQIIRDLESTQATMWSPMVLNGTGFGFTANHSLVMASYISQANAAIIDLKSLLTDG